MILFDITDIISFGANSQNTTPRLNVRYRSQVVDTWPGATVFWELSVAGFLKPGPKGVESMPRVVRVIFPRS